MANEREENINENNQVQRDDQMGHRSITDCRNSSASNVPCVSQESPVYMVVDRTTHVHQSEPPVMSASSEQRKDASTQTLTADTTLPSLRRSSTDGTLLPSPRETSQSRVTELNSLLRLILPLPINQLFSP